MIGVNLSTVRMMTEFRALHSSISNQELDQKVLEIKHVFPNCVDIA